jgi:hypothetical protein
MKSKTFYDRVSKRSSVVVNGKSKLSTKELIQAVKDCCDAINKNSIRAGEFLIIIRDENRWEQTHGSFFEFCQQNFNISRSYAHDLIESIPVWHSLRDNCKSQITNEAQIRELRKTPPQIDRNVVIEEAKKYGAVTASNLRQTIGELTANLPAQMSAIADTSTGKKQTNTQISKPVSSKPDPNRDEAQNAITPEALPYWKRKPEVEKYLDKLKDVMDLVNRAKDTTDPMYARMPKSLPERITQAYLDLLVVVPHSICPKCHGEPSLKPNGCDDCGNTGMISKADYEKINPPKPTV